MVASVYPVAADSESSVSGVSWPAVAAGSVATLALALFLLALGTGLGLSVVSPWSSEGVSASTFTIGAGIYLAVVSLIASAVGGYLAGRLRTKWTGVHADEIYFRDTAHGFLAWAFAAVVGTGLLAAAATHIAAGASVGITQAAGAPVPGSSPVDIWVDRLLRADPSTARPGGALNLEERAATRAELARIFVTGLAPRADFSAPDRAYAAQVVAARTGLAPADAERRVSEVITEARAAADATRKATRNLALWMAASMMVGAFGASLAATEGGGLRDGTWVGLRRRTA